MGFPTWTLWGMGLSALGALLATVLAYLAQSPQFLARTGLNGYRLDLRVRTFTGFALATMLLAGGFFLAGVPLGSVAIATPTAQPITAVSPTIQFQAAEGSAETAVPTATNNPQTPQSGAFGGPPPTATGEAADETAVSPVPDAPVIEVTSASALTATPSPQPTTPSTSTPTPSPTITPTPTLTPTPIEGQTAVIDTGSSTLWMRRTPGGGNLILARGGDTVILQPGHAHQGGVLWQEIMTLDGTIGWVQEDFLSTEAP